MSVADAAQQYAPNMDQANVFTPPPARRGVPGVSDLFRVVGLKTPSERMFGTAAVVSAALLITRPKFAFNADGTQREFAPFAKGKNGTYTPWYLVAAVAGVSVALFV